MHINGVSPTIILENLYKVVNITCLKFPILLTWDMVYLKQGQAEIYNKLSWCFLKR